MLEDKINNDLKQAMKAKDQLKTSCLRMIIADIQNLSIAKQKQLADEDIIGILQKQLKQHNDSIEGFKKGNRQDLVEKESKELQIIKSYLPQQLTSDEITDMVKEAVSQTAAKEQKDIGRVMGVVMSKVKGKADGNLVKEIVLKQLSKK